MSTNDITIKQNLQTGLRQIKQTKQNNNIKD